MDLQGQNGLDNTFRESWRNRGVVAWVVAGTLISFYTLLYFGGDLGLNDVPALNFDVWAQAIGLPSRWHLYGLLYTVGVVGGGVYYLRKHGNSRYNKYRIAVNVAVQVLLAFTLPLVMALFGQGSYYFSYLWPLAWYDFHPGHLASIPAAVAVWTLGGALVLAPLMAYRYGKRWYCSWVCGCGGLANTFGDPWRHLTATSTKSWKFEKVAVHTVMFIAIGSTFALFLDAFAGDRLPAFHRIVDGGQWWSVKRLYGYVVGSILAGVIGTGLYPLLGPRVWCRNFCPMAALLGLQQKLGRFQITVKPDMCISCGNCTTYCEMGIDVRSYAQSNESFTRSACVGCGMCAHVCPRGVLRLENLTRKRNQGDKARQGLPVVNL